MMKDFMSFPICRRVAIAFRFQSSFQNHHKTRRHSEHSGCIGDQFRVALGSVSEIVTIEGGSPLVNVESGSVSTVIGHDLIEKLPLNGRSFNTLLQLTPGVVIGPSSASNQDSSAWPARERAQTISSWMEFQQISVFLLWRVSAHRERVQRKRLVRSAERAVLVSVEALQEFRVETSSFAPEFGHTPGGQCS